MTEHAASLALAEYSGTHAPALFVALWVLALGGVASVWTLARRYAIPSERSRLPPIAFLGMHLLIGFGVIAGAGGLFAAIADEIEVSEDLGELDESFTAALAKAVSPGTEQVFAWVTHLGDPSTLTVLCIVVAIFLLWRGRKWLALSWTLAIAGNALLNTTLKIVFQRARPVHDAALVTADGWSFPSGHASGSVVGYGMLAYVLVNHLPSRWHMPVVLLATTFAVAVGCSRVFLRVHFPSDVIAGFASGTAWLAVCIGSIELSRYYRRMRR